MTDYPTIVTEQPRVPNQFPLVDPSVRRLAIIGEAPGETEEQYNQPFVGVFGKLLNGFMAEVGIDRYSCFVGNVCQVRPPGNEISRFAWEGEQIQSGLTQLNADLQSFDPTTCVLLGGAALRAAMGTDLKISEWRGSILVGKRGAFTGVKCIPAYHPAAVLRDFGIHPLLKFDLKRAYEESATREAVLPQRLLHTNLSADRLVHWLNTWPTGLRCSLDIEGGLGGWPCVSLSSHPNESTTIAWGRLNETDHARVLHAFARLMYRKDVPKVLQNSLYDNFVLGYGYGIPIRGVVEDTMLKGWEIFCELPKGLGTQASIWTREPFYKMERKTTDLEVYYQYCAKDSAVTLEICNAQDSALPPDSLSHYRFNMDLLQPFLFMETKGIRYNGKRAAELLVQKREEIAACAKRLEDHAGRSLRGDKGSLSSKKMAHTLYEVLKYPPQYKKEKGRRTTKLTTDIEALLALKKTAPHDTFISDIILHRHIEGLVETLQVKYDPDGRMRSGYNPVGTDTGRVANYASPTGAGTNLTTIPKKPDATGLKTYRDLYQADLLYDFCQCDLEGADGWTVAAHCARLGDSTMLDDYLAGMKPAKIIALLYHFGPAINRLSRSDLKWFHDKIFPIVKKIHGEWLYLGCKRVQHGSNYLMGIPTMILNVLKDSFKESGVALYMEHREASYLQNLYFLRYPGVKTWHSWTESVIRSSGQLVAASGNRRIFFNRRHGQDIKDTVKQALAHEPQHNTTYATNMAALKLWRDPENIRPDGTRIIEPLHQVHDALCTQWPQFCRDWSRQKMRQYFHNPMIIAGIEILIPFDGTWGPTWGNQPNAI